MPTLISSILAALTAAAASAFGLVLLAVASYAQSGSAAHVQAALNNPLNHPLPTKQSAAADGDSIRAFHVNVPGRHQV